MFSQTLKVDTIKCYPMYFNACITVDTQKNTHTHTRTLSISQICFYMHKKIHTHTHIHTCTQKDDDTIAFLLLFFFLYGRMTLFLCTHYNENTHEKKRNTFSNTFDKIMSWVTWRERVGRGKMFCKAKKSTNKTPETTKEIIVETC